MPVERNPDVPRPKYSYWVTPSRIHSDEELVNVKELMSDKYVRRRFILRVLLILLVLYGITISTMCAFHFTPVKPWIQENVWYWYIMFPLFFLSGCVLACCGRTRYKSPWHFLFMSYVTLVLSCILAGMACYISTVAVLCGIGVMGLCFVVIILVAVIPPTNFHLGYTSGFAIAITVIFTTSAVFIIGTDELLNIIVSSVIALVFIIILTIDAHLISTGRYYYPILPDEYILGATHLYIDSFIIILIVFNAGRNV